ncbi:MAG: sugar ABC transporter substrate-binding protein [Hungatella sp.]|jgi:multiple sugar transport system substrate-binding protein|nr:sugar ABC transporter substrate-binding protein [Hungatella sp.]
MKKTTSFLMCLAMSAMLAGCGQNSDNKTTDETTGSSETAAENTVKEEGEGGQVVINYYDWDIPDQKFIDDFHAANPDIQVVVHSIPANGERLTKLDILAMSGGDMDVMPISDGDQFVRFESGMMAPLDEFIERDGLDMEASFGKYAIWGQSDGKYYGIPFRATQTGVYYNKDMFDEAKVPYPSDDWTLEEYIETARKMAEWGKSQGIYGTYTHTYANEWATVAAQKGQWYTPDNQCNIKDPAWRTALETRKMLDDEGTQMPYGQIVAVKAVINSSFLGGKEAMVNAGSWLVRDMKNRDKFPFDFQVGVACLPRFDETVEGPCSNYSCSVLGIPENSKHKEEAWRFIRYYVEECSDYIAASGNLPTYLPAYSDEMIHIFCEGSGLDEEYGKKFFDSSIKLTTNKIIGPCGAQYMQIGKEEIEQYFNGEKTLEETLDNIERRVNEELAKQ